MFLFQKLPLVVIFGALMCARACLALAVLLKKPPSGQHQLQTLPGTAYNETVPVTVLSTFVPRALTRPSDTKTADAHLTGALALAMAYTPYSPSGACMSHNKITNDLQDIKNKGFNIVRVYSTDCNTLAYVGSACKKLGLKMILGIYIKRSGIFGAQEQIEAIAQWGEWEVVELIVVGNEAISNGYCSAPDLASFITTSKLTFRAAGYTGKVTTAEPIDI